MTEPIFKNILIALPFIVFVSSIISCNCNNKAEND